MKHSSLGENNYLVIFVDDYTRSKVVKFDKKKSDTAAVLLSLIAYYIIHRNYQSSAYERIFCGESEEEFQCELDRRSIT